MPKIPVYDRQVKVPSSTNPFLENVEAQGRVGRAQQAFGKEVDKQYQEYQDHQDTLTAIEKSKELSDIVNEQELKEKQLQGADSVGATNRQAKFVDDQTKLLSQGLSKGAAEKFRERSVSIRNSSTSTMQTHEARQAEIRRQNLLEGIPQTWHNKIVGGNQTKEQLDEAVNQMNTDVADNIYKGRDPEFVKQAQKSLERTMRTDWLIERANNHPELVLDEWDKYQYQSLMGEKEAALVKDVLHERVRDKIAKDTVTTLKAQHGDNYEAMLKEANNIKDGYTKQQVIGEINADLGTKIHVDNYMREQKQDRAIKDINDAFHPGIGKPADLVRARDLIMANRDVLSKDQYTYWLNRIDTEATAKKGSTGRYKEAKHLQEVNAVQSLILKRPWLVKDSQIIAMANTGVITDREKDKLLAYAKALRKGIPENMKAAFDWVDKQFKNHGFAGGIHDRLPKEDDYAYEVRKYNEMKNALRAWYMELDKKEFQKADPMKLFIEPHYRELKRGFIRQAFDQSIKFTEQQFKRPAGGYKYEPAQVPEGTQPINPDFNERDFLVEYFGDIAKPEVYLVPPRPEKPKEQKMGAGDKALEWLKQQSNKAYAKILSAIMNK